MLIITLRQCDSSKTQSNNPDSMHLQKKKKTETAKIESNCRNKSHGVPEIMYFWPKFLPSGGETATVFFVVFSPVEKINRVTFLFFSPLLFTVAAHVRSDKSDNLAAHLFRVTVTRAAS